MNKNDNDKAAKWYHPGFKFPKHPDPEEEAKLQKRREELFKSVDKAMIADCIWKLKRETQSKMSIDDLMGIATETIWCSTFSYDSTKNTKFSSWAYSAVLFGLKYSIREGYGLSKVPTYTQKDGIKTPERFYVSSLEIPADPETPDLLAKDLVEFNEEDYLKKQYFNNQVEKILNLFEIKSYEWAFLFLTLEGHLSTNKRFIIDKLKKEQIEKIKEKASETIFKAWLDKKSRENEKATIQDILQINSNELEKIVTNIHTKIKESGLTYDPEGYIN